MSIVTTQPDGTSPGENLANPDTITLDANTTVHFIGIGGSGMSALAQLLIERGVHVTGSDLRPNAASLLLVEMGATVTIGHDTANIGQADVVVISNAVQKTNIERAYAHEHNIPVLLRADLLNLLMRDQRSILIAGTHGKTSTTALTTKAIQGSALDPSFAIGGAIHSGGSSAHHGTTPIFVAEADEAFRSFLRLHGSCIVVTNIEMDHHDVYDDLDAILVAFTSFINNDPHDGPIILCGDDPGVQALLPSIRNTNNNTIITYGFEAGNDVQISPVTVDETGRSNFTIMSTNVDLDLPKEEYSLFIPGRHNVLNAVAASIAASWAVGSSDGIIRELNAYRGAVRRFQRLGTINDITVVDDYGHHPTEIAATINAAKQTAGDGRVVVVFQPHRYSRTKSLGIELGQALVGADIAIITDVYAAGEVAELGVSGHLVATAAVQAGVNVRYEPNMDKLVATVSDLIEPNDVVVTMGAGDITQFGPKLLDVLSGVTPRTYS